MTNPLVTVVITTHNRCDEVVQAVASCCSQTLACEVLVYDDASSDQTTETLQSRYPHIRVIRSESRQGYIALRNRGFREATADIVVSIDDDALFTDSHSLAGVVKTMAEFPNAAALALPYIEPYSNRATMALLPKGTRMRSYVGCAHAIRRQVAIDLGSYQVQLVHQGEERDLAIRMIDHGYEILFADTPPIVHLYSSKRDHSRVNFYGFRNTIIFCWMRIPFPNCVGRAVISTAQLLLHRFSWGSLWDKFISLGAGWLGLLLFWKIRSPVSRKAYRLYRQLASHGPLPSAAVPTASPDKPVPVSLADVAPLISPGKMIQHE